MDEKDARLETTDEPIDFDRAEYSDDTRPSFSCAACGRDIEREYYHVAGKVACSVCKGHVESEIASALSRPTFLRALRNGAIAAAVGSIVWFWITKITGYELGLVAIGIGMLVGWAVRTATKGHGAKRYQALAIFLTYSSIVWTYIPTIIAMAEKSAAEHAATQSSASTTPQSVSSVSSPIAAPSSTAMAADGPRPTTSDRPTLGRFLYAWVLLIGLAYAVPFLTLKDNILGVIIIGIGLYEAWKFTKPKPLAIEGPFVRGKSDEA